MKKTRSVALPMLASPLAAFAHGGHGMPQLHWHATDFAGLGFVVALAGLAIWLSRGR